MVADLIAVHENPVFAVLLAAIGTVGIETWSEVLVSAHT